ncbi:MAG: hypothetical protein A2020_11780 [Lentisphaerae bacterium GWF2_45_14]|nr:MAG: hypothetical protein A2020_11780 [Lentisphaerae bacterium GWF2_45_14]
MTPRKHVEKVLRWEQTDKIPFTIYESKIPQCTAEREMRNRGLCIVKRNVPVFSTRMPNVKISQHVKIEDGKQLTRTIYETPFGNVSTLSEAAGFTSWLHEKMFKSPDDYKAILFMVKDEVYEPCYEVFAKAQENFGEDAIFRAGFGLEPLQSLISGSIMDMQDFCMEWMDNRDEILKIYNAIAENRRKIYPIVAKSPALHANYGGNVTPEIIGLETFEKYYPQHYNEAAEIMHKHGKLIGCHFDANCRLLSKSIASTALDYIEAFTPAPDTDMTLEEARKAWPGKVLWLNFPSSVHLKSDDEVEQTTIDLLDGLRSTNGIIMGITEDIPEDRWRKSCPAIMNGLEKYAKKQSEG